MVKSKLVAAFLTLAIGVTVGSTGVVNAMGPTGTPHPPATKEDCKNGGWQHHTDENGQAFSNQGQCVKWVNDHGYGGGQNGGGNGGGINLVNIIKGIGNAISNVLSFLFGHIGGAASVTVGNNIQGNNNVISNVIKFVFG